MCFFHDVDRCPKQQAQLVIIIMHTYNTHFAIQSRILPPNIPVVLHVDRATAVEKTALKKTALIVEVGG